MANSEVVGILKTVLTAETGQYTAKMTAAAAAPTAVQKSVDALGKEVAKLTPLAERMVKSLGGDKLLYQANSLTQAVTKLGGAQKLTASEQERVNATVTKAIDKYKALGQQAPKAMVDLEKATKKADVSTSSFGVTLTGIGKDILTTAAGFFTAQAAFAAVRSTIHAIVGEIDQLTIHGSAVADVSDNFDRLTKQANLTGAALLGALRQGTHNTIADFELMKLVNEQLGAGLRLTEKDLGTLAKGAFALAQATGGDVKTALDSMSDAMLTGRTRALALLTGKINETAAEDKFAKSLGRTKEELSEAGKIEAHRVAILAAVGAATARLGDQVDGLDERVAQGQTIWRNFNDQLGKAVANSPVINAAFNAIGDALKNAFGKNQEDVVRGLARRIDDLAIGLVSFGKVALDVFKVAAEGAAFFADALSGIAQFLVDIQRTKLSVDAQPLPKKLLDAMGPEGRAQHEAAVSQKKDLDDLSKRLESYGAMSERVWKGEAMKGALATMQRLLDDVRTRMVAANVAANDSVSANKQAGAAAGAAASGFGAQSDSLFTVGKAADEFKKKLRELNEDIGRGMKGLTDAQFMKEFGPKLEDLSREMVKFGITSAEAGDNVRAGLDRWLNISTSQFETEIAAASTAIVALGKDAAEAAQRVDDATMESDQRRQANRRETSRMDRETEFQRAEFGIEQAKLWGASWQQVYAMESRLSHARMVAAVHDSQQAFDERVADLRRTRFVSEDEYQSMADGERAIQQRMVENFQLSEQLKRAELARTHNVWLRTWDDMKRAGYDATQTLTDSFAAMCLGMEVTWSDTWHSMQRIAAQVLSNLLNSTITGFLTQLGQKIAGSAIGGGGGGTGGAGLIEGAATKGLGKLLGIGGGFSLSSAPALGAAVPGLIEGGGVAAIEGGIGAGAGAAAGTTAGTAGGAGMGATLAGLATNPWTIGIAAAIGTGIFLAKKFGKDAVNPLRDKFTAQFGGNQKLAQQLTRFTGEPGGGHLFAALQAVHRDKGALHRAEGSIIDLFGSHGIRGLKMFNLGGFVPPGIVMPAILHGGGSGELAGPVNTIGKMIAESVKGLGGRGPTFILQVHEGVTDPDYWRGIFRNHFIPESKNAMTFDTDGYRSAHLAWAPR